jgi:hypothetical protein
MIVHAADRAARAQGVTWRQLRAEDLPAELGRFRVVTFAQSFIGWTGAGSRGRYGRCSHPASSAR